MNNTAAVADYNAPVQVQFTTVSYEQFLNDISAKVLQDLKKDQEQQDEKLLPQQTILKEVFNDEISRVTFSAWVKAGYIPSHQIGTKTLYKKSEVIASAKLIRKHSRKYLQMLTQGNDASI